MKKQLGLIGTIGFGVVALFFGVAAAQTPPAEEKAPGVRAQKMRGEHDGRSRGWKHHMGPGIHGQFTVADGNGGFKTIATQFGEATAVSSESITVKSADGFSKTYVVTEATRVGADGRDGIADIATGDKVHVSADLAGDTATATRIHEARPKPQPAD